MRNIIFKPIALEQFTNWAKLDAKIQTKISDLIKAILNEPFTGIGKPEALKHNLNRK